MLKKISIVAGGLFLAYLVACSSDNSMAGGTIDPNSIAEISSSSIDVIDPDPNTIPESSANVAEISSSSESIDFPIDLISSSSLEDSRDYESSSSSADDPDIVPFPMSSSFEGNNYSPVVALRNLSLQCKEDVIYVDNGDTVVHTPDLGELVANKIVKGDSVDVFLQDIYFEVPCGEDKQRFLQEVVEKNRIVAFFAGDTLMVDVSRSRMYSFGCSCIANVDFTLDKEYSEFNYVMFDRKDTRSVQE